MPKEKVLEKGDLLANTQYGGSFLGFPFTVQYLHKADKVSINWTHELPLPSEVSFMCYSKDSVHYVETSLIHFNDG